MITVVHDLGGNPEPLKLFRTLRTPIPSLVASDDALAVKVSQLYKQTTIKSSCNEINLLTTIELLEVELSNRAQEEEKTKER